MLPDLDWSTRTAGRVSRAAAAQTGLAEGTPVAVGTADAAAEATAAGALDAGDAMLMYGSTLFFIRICSRLPSSRLQWPTVYLEPDTCALAAGMSTAGALGRWFRDLCAGAGARGLAEDAGWDDLVSSAASVAAGSEGLLVLPYFSGERSPINDPDARGVVAGLALSHGRGHLFRAVLEGIAFGVRHNLAAMEEAGERPDRLVAIGGGTRNRLWLQIVSDAIGREQVVQQTPGACYGDAMLAAVGAGLLGNLRDGRAWLGPGELVRPDPAAAAVYERRYPDYRELYERTRGVVHRLAAAAGAAPRKEGATTA